MSRTIRRQKGDRRFANPNRRNYNNPLWGFSPFNWTYVKKIETTVEYKYSSYRGYEVKTKSTREWYEYVFLGFNELPPADRVLFDKDKVDRLQRDSVYSKRGYSDVNRKGRKEYAKNKLRAREKAELNRLKKIPDYEEMQYEPQHDDIGMWWYWD